MPTSEEMRGKGKEVLEEIGMGGAMQAAAAAFTEIAPGTMTFLDECLWGGIWARPGIPRRYRSLITISALAAQNLMELKGHIRTGLRVGLTPAEIAEAMLHLALYTTLPTALGALRVLKELAEDSEELKAAIPKDLPPRLGSLQERVDKGAEIAAQLWGADAPNWAGSAAKSAPELVELMQGYLFGEIWARPGLDIKSRVVVTLAALTALNRTVRIPVYVRAARNVGFSRDEVVEILMHTTFYAGLPSVLNALQASEKELA